MKPKGHDQPFNQHCWNDDDCHYPPNTIEFPLSGPIAFPSSDGGSSDGIHMLLQIPPNVGDHPDQEYSFKIAIHDPMSLPDLRSAGTVLDIKPGYSTTIHITPSFEVTSSSTKSMPEQERNCRFASESDDSQLFKRYSRVGCLLECQMKKAYQACNCIPWNYPHFLGNQTICHRYTQECFEDVMNTNMNLDHCSCPYDCSLTTYSFSVTQDIIKPILCEEVSFLHSWVDRIYPRFERHLNKKFHQEKFDMFDYCHKYLTKHMAVVNVHLTKSTISQQKRTQRVTFSNHFANIGTYL